MLRGATTNGRVSISEYTDPKKPFIMGLEHRSTTPSVRYPDTRQERSAYLDKHGVAQDALADTALHLVRHDVGRAVVARQVLVGLRVVDEALGVGIELKLP